MMRRVIVETPKGKTMPAAALRCRADEFSAERAVADCESLFRSLIGKRMKDGALLEEI